MSSNYPKFLLLIFILGVGILFRAYNLSYDDLWYDEIISFWVANPNFTYSETINVHNKIEDAPFFYNFILKFIFDIFGYNVFVGRSLSVISGILSIFTIIYLNQQISKNNDSYLFTSFLISTNIYLIGYSQELRNYSLLFLITTLTLIFFIKIIESEKNLKLLIIFSIIFLFNILLHPFGWIIFFSLTFYLFIKLLLKKFYSISIIISFIIIFLISAVFYYKLFSITTDAGADYYWFMENPSLSFYTNFHFSKYFGSRLIGIIFLITLLYLIIKNFKKFTEINIYTFFLIFIIFSYFVPILFGYLFKPIFLPRYTMFNLIPIFLILSVFTFNYENKTRKFLIISLLSLATIGNHFTEQTIKQFYKLRTPSKPEYSKAVNYIYKSISKEYILKVENMKNNQSTSDAIENYISYLNKDLKLIEFKNIGYKKKIFWYICPLDISSKDCILPESMKNNSKLLEQKQFNSIILNLVEIETKS